MGQKEHRFMERLLGVGVVVVEVFYSQVQGYPSKKSERFAPHLSEMRKETNVD